MAFWKMTANDAERVDIDIYGDIGDDPWGDEASVSAKQFLDLVRNSKGKAIDLHVNSGGGSVFDAFAMMTALAAHDGKVTAHVDGIAASAASFLLAAADEVRMSSTAFIMIHNASTVAWGNATAIRETADWLDTIDRQLAGIYAKRGNRDASEFLSAMAETTWFTADEAAEWGLVDAIDEAVAAAACITADKATIASRPEGVALNNVTGHTPAEPAESILAPVGDETASTGHEGESDAAGAASVAQERAVVVDGCIYRIHPETTD